MTKFNVGDKVRVIKEFCEHSVGKVAVIDRYDPRDDEFTYGFENNGGWIDVGSIELVSGKKRNATDRRLTEAEAKIAALESKVAALETVLADKSKLTIAADFAKGSGFPAYNKSPNQRRADVIKRAQAFLKENAKSSGVYIVNYPQFVAREKRNAHPDEYATCIVKYKVDADKRTIVALMIGSYTGAFYARGIAKCAPDDVFNADIGKAIALGRTLGVNVPKEFTDAVKPTEVVVGTKIKYYATKTGEFKFDIQTATEDEALTNNADLRGDDPNYFVKIVDDTEAVYL